MPIRIPLEVCSECQLDCAHCAHKSMRSYNPNYHLSLDDLETFLDVTEKSGYMVDLFLHGPGEPLLWRNLKQGVSLMRKSKSVNDIVITTNGIALQNATDILDDITRIDVSSYPSVVAKKLEHDKIQYVQKTHFAIKQYPAKIPCTCICPGPMIYGNQVFPTCGPCVFDALNVMGNNKNPLSLAEKITKNYYNSEEMFGKLAECAYCWANSNADVIVEEHRLIGKGIVPHSCELNSDRETLVAEVQKFPFWFHKIPLPYGVITPGWGPLDPEVYEIPEDFSGKRVLDVGARDGYWSFEALRRGAREVVAIDDFSDDLGRSEGAVRKVWATFDFCRSVLGYSEDQCRRYSMSVYDVTPEKLGLFDVVFFFGAIYHLRHPLLALDKLSAVCKEEIYIESAILDDCSPYQGGFGHGYKDTHVVMEFYQEDEYAGNKTNWWVPTLECLARMTKAAGFQSAVGWKFTENPDCLDHCRGFVCGVKS